MLGIGHISRAVGGAATLGKDAADRTADAAGRAMLATLDRVLESELTEKMVDRVLDSELAAHAVRQALDGPLVDSASPGVTRLADRVIESPAAERLVGRVIEGPLLDQAVARLLESEDLWMFIDVIARSPAVTDAISTQGLGFADQVAGVVRTRSLSADNRLESVVRGLVRRRRAQADPVIPPPPTET